MVLPGLLVMEEPDLETVPSGLMIRRPPELLVIVPEFIRAPKLFILPALSKTREGNEIVTTLVIVPELIIVPETEFWRVPELRIVPELVRVTPDAIVTVTPEFIVQVSPALIVVSVKITVLVVNV